MTVMLRVSTRQCHLQAMYENHLFNLLLVFMIAGFGTKLMKAMNLCPQNISRRCDFLLTFRHFRLTMKDLMSLMMDFIYVTVPSNMAWSFPSWYFAQRAGSVGFISFNDAYPKSCQSFSVEINSYQWISVQWYIYIYVYDCSYNKRQRDAQILRFIW